ncbi:hypothetical protein [Armatimonas sp.]|uniref:hypothetical protein n=1 Tax=Armatimonas sp. TaxID=1872638 RepID=UPI0037523D52
MAFKRREQKRVHLGVRVLRAQVAWLDAPYHWEGGRLTWGGSVPDAGLLWKTQKRLHELRQLGQSTEALQHKLEQAKWLLTLTEASGVVLLLAEALCEDALPCSPSQLVAKQGQAALPELQRLAADPLTPEDAQPLLGLMITVCQGARKLPSHPDLTARLLAQQPGFPVAFLGELPILMLTPTKLRAEVRGGLSADAIACLLEQVSARSYLFRSTALSTCLMRVPFASVAVALELAETLHQREVLPTGEEDSGPLVRRAPGMHDALALVLERDDSAVWLALLVRCAALLWPHPELTVKNRLWGKNREDAIQRKAQLWRQERHVAVESLYQIFSYCQDAELAEKALRADKLWRLRFVAAEPELYRLAWALYEEFPGLDSDLSDVLQKYRSVAEFRADFGEALRVIRAQSAPVGGLLLAAILWNCQSETREVRRQLPQLAPRLTLLLPLIELPGTQLWHVREFMGTLGYLPDSWLLLAIELYKKVECCDAEKVQLAFRLAEGDESRFVHLLEKLLVIGFDWVPLQAAYRFGAQLPRFPALAPLFCELMEQQPRRAVERMAQLGEALRLGLEALEPLQKLAPSVESLPEEWESIARLLPDVPDVPGLPDLAWAATEPLPPGIAKLLALPERLRREAEYLSARPELAVRHSAVLARLADEAALLRTIIEEVKEAVTQRARLLRGAALTSAVEEVYRNRLRGILGSRALLVRMTPNVMNAALLTLDITENRRLLIRLLRAYFDGDRDWALRQRPNLIFLEALTARGVDALAWRAPHGESVSGLHLHLETDPLHVLQMGNYFDTCLSFGGINAFSTVANACDANKRVLYVRDTKGRIVARQLLALNSEDQLVGFNLYSTLSAEERPKLTRAVVDYIQRFATRCGLELGSEGTVPPLLATDWYDDGITAWDDLRVSPVQTSAPRVP